MPSFGSILGELSRISIDFVLHLFCWPFSVRGPVLGVGGTMALGAVRVKAVQTLPDFTLLCS